MTKPIELAVGDRVTLMISRDDRHYPPKGTRGTVIVRDAGFHAPEIPIAWDGWDDGWVTDDSTDDWIWNGWSVARDHIRRLPARKVGK